MTAPFDMWGNPTSMPRRENFDYHVLMVVLPRGGGQFPEIRVECKGADKDDCACDKAVCHLEENYKMVGWEILRAAGEIELAKLSGRMDWSDIEEPWIDVEP